MTEFQAMSLFFVGLGVALQLLLVATNTVSAGHAGGYLAALFGASFYLTWLHGRCSR